MGSTESKQIQSKRKISEYDLPRVVTLRTNDALKMQLKSSVLDQSITDVDLGCKHSVIQNGSYESLNLQDSFLETSEITHQAQIYIQDYLAVDFSISETQDYSF